MYNYTDNFRVRDGIKDCLSCRHCVIYGINETHRAADENEKVLCEIHGIVPERRADTCTSYKAVL